MDLTSCVHESVDGCSKPDTEMLPCKLILHVKKKEVECTLFDQKDDRLLQNDILSYFDENGLLEEIETYLKKVHDENEAKCLAGVELHVIATSYYRSTFYYDTPSMQ